ncbi:MAG: hypothetical protein R3C32_11555 [Chloroflexota bacterium]
MAWTRRPGHGCTWCRTAATPGAYPDTFSREAAREALGLAPDHVVFLFPARSDATRGSWRLIDAFRTMERRDVRLVVAGRLERAKLARRSRDTGMTTSGWPSCPATCRTTGCRSSCAPRTSWSCPIGTC